MHWMIRICYKKCTYELNLPHKSKDNGKIQFKVMKLSKIVKMETEEEE